MVLIEIRLSKAGLSPPVFLAGSFTQWQPRLEMDHHRAEAESKTGPEFTKLVDLEPGEYQYKFRLGSGDWWVVDESAPTVTDAAGNTNNILRVEKEAKKIPDGSDQNLMHVQVDRVSQENGPGSSVRSRPQSQRTSPSQVTRAAPESVASDRSILTQGDTEVYQADLFRPMANQDKSPKSPPDTDQQKLNEASRSSISALLRKVLCCGFRRTVFGIAVGAVAAVALAWWMKHYRA